MTNDTRTLTLTAFLLARIAEDEADWRAVDARDVVEMLHGRPLAPRMLAECEAKRRIIEAAWDDHMRIEGEWGMCRSREQLEAANDHPPAVQHLAAVYADHPDYREEWS